MFNEDVTIDTDGLSLIGVGDGVGETLIDYAGKPGTNNAAMHVTADNVTLQAFKLLGDGDSSPRYGVKLHETQDATIEDVTVEDTYRTALDVLGGGGLLVDGLTLTNNGGHGIQLLDVTGATVQNITTSAQASRPHGVQRASTLAVRG